MKKTLLLRSASDGVFQGILLGFLSRLSISSYIDTSFMCYFIVVIVFVVIFSVVFYLILHKQSVIKSVVLLSGISFISFLLTAIILFAFQISYPLSFFMPREVNNADGILLLFILGVFLGLTILFRLVIVCLVLIKNNIKSK